eukprot:1790915-Rhodomonas_salina.1
MSGRDAGRDALMVCYVFCVWSYVFCAWRRLLGRPAAAEFSSVGFLLTVLDCYMLLTILKRYILLASGNLYILLDSAQLYFLVFLNTIGLTFEWFRQDARLGFRVSQMDRPSPIRSSEPVRRVTRDDCDPLLSHADAAASAVNPSAHTLKS